MALEYLSELTTELTPDNWQDKINLQAMSLDDLITLRGDMQAMEKFGKMLTGFLKEVIAARLPDDEYVSPYYVMVRTHRLRKGGLDEAKITDEMGEDWVEDHRKPPTEYDELRQTRKKEEA
jgi:hypothetical protein